MVSEPQNWSIEQRRQHAETFRHANVVTELSDDITHAILGSMAEDTHLFSFDLSASFTRAILIDSEDNPYNNASRMVAHLPEHAPRHNRCNVPGDPKLYLADTHDTVFHELRASDGELYQMARFNIRQGLSLRTTWLGMYDYFLRNGNAPEPFEMHHEKFIEEFDKTLKQLDPEKLERTQFFDQFISEQFRQVVDGKKLLYKPTANFARILFENSLDAIAYPSTRYDAGWNVAVRPELFHTHFDVSNYMVVRVFRNTTDETFSVKCIAKGYSADSETIEWQYLSEL